MKILKTMIVVTALLSFIPMVSAQTAGTATGGTTASPTIKTIREEVVKNAQDARGSLTQTNQAERQVLRAGAESLKTDLQNTVNAIKSDTALTVEARQEAVIQAREEARTTLQAQVESVKQTVTQNREEFRATLEANREEAKQKIEAERRELQTKLQAVRDENKKKIVENVAEQLQKVNTNYLNRLTTTLGNLEEILRNIASRADKAELAGRDVSQVRTDITEAEALIASVRGYITQQAGTTYPIDITDEANLGSDVSGARNRLHADLTIIKAEITKVHEAVRKAASGLAKIPNVNEGVEDSNQ